MSGDGESALPPSGPRDSEPRPQDETIVQAVEGLGASRELSVPAGIEQNPSAPAVGGYILTQLLGRGAFADVWRAWQQRTRKLVAIKIFRKREGVNWLYLQREVERLIRLDKHPHIVSLLDADLSGEPSYYAMDLLDGGSLEHFVGRRDRPSAADVARWLEEVCEALGYVHAKGLIHCDLKPANVLLDEQGRVRVADFGQSQVLSESAGSLGTLFYMAPEQALLGEEEAPPPDVRWDVYALGAMAYALMTGEAPYSQDRKALESAPSLQERLAVYRKLTRARSLDWGPAATALADEDLVAIAAKCAEPDPRRRYETVAAVKADLEARRRLMPVSPLAFNRGYRARRFLQRNLALVALGAAAAAALVAAGAQVVQARSDAVRRLAFSYAMRGRQFSEQGDPASAAAYYAESNRLEPSYLARAAALAHLSELPLPRRILPHKWGVRGLALDADGLRALTVSWEKGAALWDLSAQEPVKRVLPHETPVNVVAFSPDGKRAVTGAKDGRIRLWNAQTAAAETEWAAHSGEVSALGFSPDGSLLLSGDSDGEARIWDAAGGGAVGPALAHAHEIVAVRLSPDGARLITAQADGEKTVWNLSKREREMAFRFEGGVAVSRDGAHAAYLDDAGVFLHDQSTSPARKSHFPDAGAACLAISPDGGRVVTGSADGTVRVWDGLRGLALASLTTPAPVGELLFHPEGRGVFVSGGDGAVRFWDLGTDQPPGPALRHSGVVGAMVLSGDAKLLATTAGDGAVRLWSVPPPEPCAEGPPCRAASGPGSKLGAAGGALPADARVGGHAGPVTSLAFSRKGDKLLSAGAETVQVWDGAGGKSPAPTLVHGSGVTRAVFSPDASLIATASEDGKLRVWESGSDRPLGDPIELKGAILALAFSPDGHWLLTGEEGGWARVWESRALKPGADIAHAAPVTAVAVSPDGRRFAAGAADGTVSLNRLEAGNAKPLARLAGHADWIASLAFSPDGRKLLAGSWDNSARWWDLPRCEREAAAALRRRERENLAAAKSSSLRSRSYGDDAKSSQAGLFVPECDPAGTPLRHEGDVAMAAFDPAGRRIATASWDGTASVWNAATGEPVGSALRHAGGVSSLAFSPDGKAVLTGGWDGAARLWDADTGEPLTPPYKTGAPATRVAFAPDGRNAAVAAADGAMLSFPTRWLSDSVSAKRLASWARVATQRRITESGDIELLDPQGLGSLSEALAAAQWR